MQTTDYKRIRIIVDGKVQGVMYRRHIQDTIRANKLKNLTGYIENMEDGTVEIVCEGPEKEVNSFFEIITKEKTTKVPNYPLLDIVEIEKFEEKPTRKYNNFRIHFGTTQEELNDQMSASYNVLLDYSQKIEKLDNKYGEISKNVGSAAIGLEMLSRTIVNLDEHMREDREVIKKLTNDVNLLVKKILAEKN